MILLMPWISLELTPTQILFYPLPILSIRNLEQQAILISLSQKPQLLLLTDSSRQLARPTVHRPRVAVPRNFPDATLPITN